MNSFHLFTLFPNLFEGFMKEGLLSQAQKNGQIEINLVNYREFGLGKHRKVDDTPYGGGAGMLLRPEPIFGALEDTEKKIGSKLYKILLCPQGEPFSQKLAWELSKKTEPLAFITGRYEGFDERIREEVDLEISLGDFVMMGGDVAAMAIIEAVGRLVPGVIGNWDSLIEESFSGALLEHPQYTKPLEFQGKHVPEVLTSGHHGKIKEWRLSKSIERTKQRRPELYKKYLGESKE
ncbi:MAG: tRNA (guanosine(37)-N1)-methyltransferase TrmD [SAR324 cluster bacterium]|nr:tRNA (guanosine(37)-N1)-methyltransferase TrmD [SAR324 cluster bacterium]